MAEIEDVEASARPGGTAAGGNAPRPDDLTNPQKADDRAKKTDEKMVEAGFGDHAGGRLRRPDERGPEQR